MPANGTQLFEELMRFKPDGLSANGWAVKAGVSRTFWNDLKRHGNPSRRTLEKLLAAAGSSLAEFEALRIGEPFESAAGSGPSANVADMRPAGWRAAPLAPVPLLEARLAGEWGMAGTGVEMIELHPGGVRALVARPASMAGDRQAYALVMMGDAMWPRFRPGRQLLISPAAPIAIGDDVVVQLAGSAGQGPVKLLIKELVRRAAGFVELRQFTPDVTFRVEAAQIAQIHKVMGEVV